MNFNVNKASSGAKLASKINDGHISIAERFKAKHTAAVSEVSIDLPVHSELNEIVSVEELIAPNEEVTHDNNASEINSIEIELLFLEQDLSYHNSGKKEILSEIELAAMYLSEIEANLGWDDDYSFGDLHSAELSIRNLQDNLDYAEREEWKIKSAINELTHQLQFLR